METSEIPGDFRGNIGDFGRFSRETSEISGDFRGNVGDFGRFSRESRRLDLPEMRPSPTGMHVLALLSYGVATP